MISFSRALAFASFAAASAWPILFQRLTQALMSPLEWARQGAICGAPLRSDFAIFGHCLACWGGSLILAATGALILVASSRKPAAFPARR